MGAPILRTQKGKPPFEVAQILRRYLPGFLRFNKITLKQFRVVRAIVSCRTEALGGHMQECDHCRHRRPVYNSCGDRHCPKCQGAAKNKWLKTRLQEILPVHHFHVVFTIPHLFNTLIRYNRKLIYDILFKASAETLLKFGKDPKQLGAQLGFIGILHTWTQTLILHAHIHYLVPAGGLSFDGKRWVDIGHKGKFLFPCLALSDVFRGIFIEHLKKAYYTNRLVLVESMNLSDSRAFDLFVDQAVSRKWNVYAKPPFSGPEEVVLYIGRYTHRTAITNGRLLSLDGGAVSFTYKAKKKKGLKRKTKIMSLPAVKFIQRYLDHILPQNYHKIRFFGFMSNGRRAENLEIIKKSIAGQGVSIELNEMFIKDFMETLEVKDEICPKCQYGIMHATTNIDPLGYYFISVPDTG